MRKFKCLLFLIELIVYLLLYNVYYCTLMQKLSFAYPLQLLVLLTVLFTNVILEKPKIFRSFRKHLIEVIYYCSLQSKHVHAEQVLLQ